MEWASPWHLKELVIQERGKPCQQKHHKVACDVCHRGDVLLWVWSTRKRTDDNDWGRLKRPRVSGTGWYGTWKQRKGRTGLAIWKHMVQRAYQRLIKDRRGQLRRCEAEKKKKKKMWGWKETGSRWQLSLWMWTCSAKVFWKKWPSIIYSIYGT